MMWVRVVSIDWCIVWLSLLRVVGMKSCLLEIEGRPIMLLLVLVVVVLELGVLLLILLLLLLLQLTLLLILKSLSFWWVVWCRIRR